MFDILIKKGLVFDGLANKPQNLDLAIKDGKISQIGNLKNEKAKIEINASEQYICPGFIEINSLADRDFSIFLKPKAENYLLQGVTTVIGGAGGASLYPLISGSLESLNKWLNYRQINIKWQKLSDFFAILEKRGLTVNFGSLISWATLRSDFTNREFRTLSKEEKEKLKFMVEESLKEGAMGIAFALGSEEERVVGIEEILEIGEIVKKFKGYLGFSLRDETDGFLSSLREILEVAEKGKLPIEIYQLKVFGEDNYAYFKDALQLIEDINEKEELVNFDTSPYETTILPLMSFLPDWAAVGGWSVFLKNIREEIIYQKLIQDLKKKKNLISDLIITSSENEPFFIGKDLKELAINFNLTVEESLIKILEINNGRVFVFSRNLSPENVKTAVSSEFSFISAESGFYDREEKCQSLIHPKSFDSFVKFLTEYSLKNKVLSLEEAIYKITGKVAKKIGLKNRGTIKENNWADIVIISPEKLSSLASYKNPYLSPLGIETIIINGKIAYDKGIISEEKAGKIMRR